MPAKLTSHVDEAAAVLKRCGLVAFPTETVYGLGADALNAQAVARIFEAKQRPAFDPLSCMSPDSINCPNWRLPFQTPPGN